LTSNGDIDSKVVSALETMATTQKVKKAKVYTAGRDNSSGEPNQWRSLGSIMAKTIISSTAATRNAGQAIHIHL